MYVCMDVWYVWELTCFLDVQPDSGLPIPPEPIRFLAANGLIRAKKWMDRFVIWFCSGGSKNDFSEFCFNHRFEDKTGIPALSAVEVRWSFPHGLQSYILLIFFSIRQLALLH